MNNKKIGIFDSGFGGITILREIVKKIPQYSYIYLGDSQRAPYGSRSQSEIYKFSCQAVNFLLQKNCQLIIFACNTASAKALRKVQQEYLPKIQKNKTKRVLGVIIPTVEIAVKKTKNKKIGILGTESTVASLTFTKEIEKLDNKIQVTEIDCPLLVPMIEAGEHDSKIINSILEKYLKPLIKKNIDTLILGCTHYSVLKNRIKKLLPANIKILAEPKIIAEKLQEYLARHVEIESQLAKHANIKFFTTCSAKRFEKLGSEFFGVNIEAEVIKLA